LLSEDSFKMSLYRVVQTSQSLIELIERREKCLRFGGDQVEKYPKISEFSQ
jgi:hypothetical protein